MATKKSTFSKNIHLDKINQEYGKMPPQAVDLEEAALGAILLEKNALMSVLDILKPESFYKEAHQKIYKAIFKLSEEEKPIDILTVTEALRATGDLESVGGPYYIAQLSSKVASAAHVEFHSRIISQKYIQRELIRVSTEIQSRAYDESIDVDDLIDFSESQIFDIADGNIKKETEVIKVLINEVIHQIQEAGKREDGLSGVPSGFTKIDRITSGWQASDLVIIAARPSMGKTAFVLSMTREMAVEHNIPVAFFSLEMSSVQLVNRLVISETQLPSERIRNGRLEDFEWEQLDYKIKRLTDAPIYIDDTPAISVSELRAKARRLKSKYNIGILIIDYLQLMTGSSETRGNREQEVSLISRTLKAIAKDLKIPIIALSQLNRSVESRGGDKRPQLSDLRESGAIEQDADLVCFIHRPEYYGMFEDENGNSLIGIAEIIIAKHRNGAIGDVPLRFRKESASFIELDEFDPMQTEEQAMTIGSKMNANIDKSSFSPFNIGANTEFEEKKDKPF